jgi:hypothetical protein
MDQNAAITLLLFILGGFGTAAVWISKLGTRVAVLEAGHDAMQDLLQEIKSDIKELVNALHGSDSVLVNTTRRIKKKP